MAKTTRRYTAPSTLRAEYDASEKHWAQYTLHCILDKF